MSTIPELAQLEGYRHRTRIIEQFLEAQGKFLSGTEIAQTMDISRTAVWKHIRALEDLGFEFTAVPRRGYRLTQVPNVLIEPLLKPYIASNGELGRNLVWFKSVSSTNAIASELARLDDTPHGTIVTAVKQSEGRGRQGREWSSPQGGLWMSTILKHSFALVRAAELTLMASVAVARAVEIVTDLTLDIKWPNDLLYRGKKVCGILAELRAGGERVQHAVLGIGLNSNVREHQIPIELRPFATSLVIETQVEVSQAKLAGTILQQFEEMYHSLTMDGPGFAVVAAEWERRCVTLGHHVRVQTPHGLLEGLATRVDGHGVLYLVDKDGHETPIHSGDVLF